MSYTQAHLDALVANLAKGVTELKIDGEEVKFASLADMRRLKLEMEAELSGTSAGKMNVITPLTNRGL